MINVFQIYSCVKCNFDLHVLKLLIIDFVIFIKIFYTYYDVYVWLFSIYSEDDH